MHGSDRANKFGKRVEYDYVNEDVSSWSLYCLAH